MSDHHKPDSPLAQLMIAVSGAGGSDHDNEPPGVTPIHLKAGHEPDKFDVRPILYVPLLVVVVLLVAYSLVSGVFFSIKDPKPTPGANPVIAKKNEDPSSNRFAAVSSIEAAAEVKQPRLEYFNPQITKQGQPEEPAYLRSRLKNPTGSAVEITPQDLYPEHYVDLTTGRKQLAEYGWADGGKKFAQLPIEVAMDQVIAGKKLPVRKDPVHPAHGTAAQSKLSNAGRGGPSQPAAAKKDDHGHDHK